LPPSFSLPGRATKAPIGLVILLTGLVMVGQMSTSMYLPSLPSLADDLDVEPGGVKLTMTVFLAAFAAAQLFFGPLSDRIGRRPALFLGLALYVLGTAGCAAAPDLYSLIAARLVQGFGACSGPAIARATVRDRYERAEAARVLAYIGMAMAVGPAVGPILGGLLQVEFGWRSVFVALVVFGAAVWIAAARGLSESLAKPDPEALAPGRLTRNYLALLQHRAFVGNMLVTSFIFGGMFTYATAVPFVLIEQLGMSPDLFGTVFIFTVIGSVTGSTISSRTALSVSGDVMTAIGATTALTGGALMLAFTLGGWVTPVTIVGSMMIFMCGFGLAAPSALAGAMAPFPLTAGAASAMIGFTQMGMAALGSMAIAFFYDGTAVPMAAVVFSMGALSALSYLIVIRARAATT
jgi:DHA1 family bicyclomycin/chloramphenicol resistance-like MFS transporter